MNTFPCTGLMGPPWGQGVGLTHKKPRCGEGDSEAASAEPWLVGTEGELREEAGRPAFSPDAESRLRSLRMQTRPDVATHICQHQLEKQNFKSRI